jgi:hypothetical protein
MIVMTAPPCQNDYVAPYDFGMKEVDRVITEVCQKEGYIHISHYRAIFEYAEKTGSLISTLIEKDGSHPNDEGYTAMWKIMQLFLGFADGLDSWESGSPALFTTIKGSQPPYLLSTSPITDFEVGKATVCETTSFQDKTNFPGADVGLLITYRGLQNDLFSYQIYQPKEKYHTYRRTWNYGGSTWNVWEQAAMARVNGSAAVSVGTVTAETVKEIEVITTTMNSAYKLSCEIVGTIPANIMTSIHLDYTVKRVYCRFYNPTAGDIIVGNLTLSYIEYDLGS